MGKVLLYNHLDRQFRVVERESLEEGLWLGGYHEMRVPPSAASFRHGIFEIGWDSVVRETVRIPTRIRAQRFFLRKYPSIYAFVLT